MYSAVMSCPAASISDVPPDNLRQILAAAVRGVQVKRLHIASDARDDDKYGWNRLLSYLHLRGVCSE
jgi:hypothetical protein